MAKRVSHSLADPYLTPLVPATYPLLQKPRHLPPEVIMLAANLTRSMHQPITKTARRVPATGNCLADLRAEKCNE